MSNVSFFVISDAIFWIYLLMDYWIYIFYFLAIT